MPEGTKTATISTRLDRRTLLVGSPDALREKFPAVADELLSCKQLTVCGELDDTNPADELADRISRHDSERLWIVGGDGTINLVAECALRNNLKFECWLTPAGTANDLARSLKEVSDRRAAAIPEAGWGAKLLQKIDSDIRIDTGSTSAPESNQYRASIGEPLLMDLVRVALNGNSPLKACANMLTLGTSARNTQHVTSEIKARWGALAYLTQAWRAMNDLEPFSIRLAVGDSQSIIANDILNIFVANGAYCGGGYGVAPSAELDDGLFNVVLLRRGTPSELAHLTATFLAGNHLEHALIEHFTAAKLVLESDTDTPLTLDGEATSAKRIELECAPHRLSIQLVDG